MPRKKRTTHSRQAKLKNMVRGSSGAPFAVEALKQSVKTEEAQELSLWLRRTHAASPRFRYLLPRSPSRVGGLTLGTTQDVGEEFSWAVGILSAEKKSLKEYVSRRQDLDSALERGEFDRARVLLERIVEAVGWSHHIVGTMCYLIGQTEGLEAQKHWIDEHVFSKTTSPIVFFAYWLGVRTEPNANANVFHSSIDRYIRSADDPEEEVFLQHILLGSAASPDHEATLIRQLQSQSLVDLYEGLVIQAMAAASDFRSTSEIYFSSFIPLMKELNDIRSTRISAAMGDREAFEKLRAEAAKWNSTQGIISAQQHASRPVTPAPQIYGDLLRSIGSIGVDERDLRTKLGQYTYSSLWSRLSQFAGTAYRLRTATSIEDILLQYRFRFLHDSDFDHFLFGALHPAVVSERLNDFSDRDQIQESATFQLGKALVSRNFFEIEARCAELREKAGREDAELLRIEVVSYLEQGAHHSLVQRLYPLIAASDEVIPLLPYSKIAASLTDSVIQEVGQHPETAVLLARLVPYTSEQTRSQLIYSIEQYLGAIGVERASQIEPEVLKQCPAARELVLLGCQMETLALSLNFFDGEEMQEERILELQLLGDIDDDLRDLADAEIEE